MSRTRPSSWGAILVMSLFFAPCVFGGHPLSVDDPGTLDPSTYELEVAANRACKPEVRCREYGVALRRGLLEGLDVGAALGTVDPEQGDGFSVMGFDAKFAQREARGLRPAVFLRLDAGIPDLDRASLEWGGVALGAAWPLRAGEVCLELGGFAPSEDLGRTEDVALGIAVYRELSPHWAVMAEWGNRPFDNAGDDGSALVGVAREIGRLGVASLGFGMAQRNGGVWVNSQWTVGLTRGWGPGI